MISIGTRAIFSPRSRISRGLPSWIVSQGTKKVLLLLIMLSRFFASAFWKRAQVSLTGERVAMYATLAFTPAFTPKPPGSGIAL